MIENLYCKCGQPINVEKDVFERTFRRDGIRFFEPEQKAKTACLFRCPACLKVVEYSELVELGYI